MVAAMVLTLGESNIGPRASKAGAAKQVLSAHTIFLPFASLCYVSRQTAKDKLKTEYKEGLDLNEALALAVKVTCRSLAGVTARWRW